MGISEYTTIFAGRRVVWHTQAHGTTLHPPEGLDYYVPRAWNPPRGSGGRAILKDPTRIAYRIGGGQRTECPDFADILEELLEDPKVGLIEALVVGENTTQCRSFEKGPSPAQFVEELVAARERLAGLKALFLSDIIYLECEISWLAQVHFSPIADAYPLLEEVRLRGAGGLSLAGLRHPNLRALTIETGGLPASVLDELWTAKLPNLERLELWLGLEEYGGIDDVEPLRPVLNRKLFPKLKHLGLRDSAIADEVARAVARARVVDRIESLDLSLGNMTDEGARALIQSRRIAGLKRLDVHHHFISPEVVAELQGLGPEVDASDRHEPEIDGGEEYRYIAHAE